MIESDYVGNNGLEVGFVILDRILGKPGEQGEVWLAKATVPTKEISHIPEFAVKISRQPVSGTQDAGYTAFMNEFDVAASLTHSCATRVYCCGLLSRQDKMYPYYIMEYLGKKVLPLEEAMQGLNDCHKCELVLRTFFDIAGPLSELHRAHPGASAHGDIKSTNILVHRLENEPPNIKLIDFGFSRLLPAEDSDAVMQARAGRTPRKASSIPRPMPAKTPQHADVWQLCFMTDRLLSELSDNCTGNTCKYCPIDGRADLPRLKDLLQEWGASTPKSKPEEEPSVDEFYRELDELGHGTDLSVLPPDTKGSVRALAIDEVATTARIKPAFEMIRIPPTKMVVYPERIKILITRPEFGVLRYVRQLGFCHLVYPGALGTRFEHALGVFDLACRFALRMSGHAQFRRHCANPEVLHAFIVTALLHDIGHFPYAHQLEEFSRNDFTDHDWAKVSTLVAGHTFYGGKKIEMLRSELTATGRYADGEKFGFSNEAVDLIKSWILGDDGYSQETPASRFFGRLLDGAIDLDKLDYVERDAHHCGVPYGNEIDIERLMDTIRINEDTEGNGGISLVFHRRSIGAIEQLASARHQMYAHVYWHRAVRAATVMFKHAFYLLKDYCTRDELETLFWDTTSDDVLLERFSDRLQRISETHGSGGEAIHAIRQILESVSGQNRNLYKAVLDLRGTDTVRAAFGHTYGNQRSVANRLWKMLMQRGYINADTSASGNHNLLIDSRVDKEIDYDKIIIVDDEGKREKLTEASPSTGQLGSDFRLQACRVRVFVNIMSLKRKYRSKAARCAVGAEIQKEAGFI